jgi:hypothetical protein
LKNGVSNLLTARGAGSAARGAGTIIAQDQQALEPKFIFSSKETLAAAPIPSFSIFNLQPSQFFQQHSNLPHQPSHNTTTFNNHHHHTHKSTTKKISFKTNPYHLIPITTTTKSTHHHHHPRNLIFTHHQTQQNSNFPTTHHSKNPKISSSPHPNSFTRNFTSLLTTT